MVQEQQKQQQICACNEDEADYEEEEAALDSNLLYEVMRRVDGVTLATSSCVSSSFYGISRDEDLWESLCNSRWPSTREPSVKKLISSIGGFRRFFRECYPLILSNEPLFMADQREDADSAEFWWDSDEEESEVPLDRSPSHLVSIVDVLFKGHSIFSRTVEGIPGADDYLGWFSTCPFRIDLLKHSSSVNSNLGNGNNDEEDNDNEELESSSEVGSILRQHLPFVESLDRERKEGKLWKALLENVRLSWILIDKRTKQLANLTSWKPILGQRHWPTDEGFFLRFGSVLPAFSAQSVQCNIVVKFRFSSADLRTTSAAAAGPTGPAPAAAAAGPTGLAPAAAAGVSLRLTELSMQLEDMGGLHLNGRDSLAVLYKALRCSKSYKHTEVLRSCHRYLKAQSEIREKKLRHEGQRDTYTVLGFIGAFMWLSYSFLP